MEQAMQILSFSPENDIIRATRNQEWELVLILLQSKNDFKKETLEYVFGEAFKFSKGDLNKLLLSKVASLLDVKVKNIIHYFNIINHFNGSTWSHQLAGDVQMVEICKDSVTGYCKLENSEMY